MSCQKTVILTKTDGLWDEKIMKHNQNVIFVPPLNSKIINSTVKDLVKNKKLDKIGQNARKCVEKHFNTKIMANSILSVINDNKTLTKLPRGI